MYSVFVPFFVVSQLLSREEFGNYQAGIINTGEISIRSHEGVLVSLDWSEDAERRQSGRDRLQPDVQSVTGLLVA